MKKLFTLVMALSGYLLSAQDLAENQHLGKIIKSDASTEDGVIEANTEFPWSFQKEIKFYDTKLLGTKIKGKDKKEFGPKDIRGFTFDDRTYESNKFADLSAVGPASLGAMYFLEVVLTGKINLYHLYDSPPTFISGTTIEEANAAARTPRLLIKKGDDKVKELTNNNISKFIEDCPSVLAKYDKGEYGNTVRDPNKSLAGNLLAKALAGSPQEAILMDIVKDYNATMK